jgi:molybdate transport system substrate-binding protein
MFWIVACIAGVLSSWGGGGDARAETVRIAAAVSLREAATEIAAQYKKETGDEIVWTFGSSGQLAAQIRNGAEIDGFISAAQKQIDDLAKDGFVDAANRQIVARNSLVLIVPAGATGGPASFAALADASVKRIAIGEPKTVPAGDYALQTLTSLKLADKLAERLVYGANVRQVLTYVENGDVTAGLVYATDALESGAKVKVVATADPATHQPIVYPAVLATASKRAAATTRALAYLCSAKARLVLAAKGFVVDEPTTAAATAPATEPVK